MNTFSTTSTELSMSDSDGNKAGKGALNGVLKQRKPGHSQDQGRCLPGFPAGWFAVGFSHELSRGKILSRQYMGHQLVLFRAQSGTACAVDAYCPHLGAHFGHGGTIEGEVIRCPRQRELEADREAPANQSTPPVCPQAAGQPARLLAGLQDVCSRPPAGL